MNEGRDLARREYTKITVHHRADISAALYKMGESVTVIPENASKQDYVNHSGIVIGLRWANDEVEYAISGLDFLVWEFELCKEYLS